MKKCCPFCFSVPLKSPMIATSLSQISFLSGRLLFQLLWWFAGRCVLPVPRGLDLLI